MNTTYKVYKLITKKTHIFIIVLISIRSYYPTNHSSVQLIIEGDRLLFIIYQVSQASV